MMLLNLRKAWLRGVKSGKCHPRAGCPYAYKELKVAWWKGWREGLGLLTALKIKQIAKMPIKYG